MDQAITRAAGATPSTTPPAAAASRLVGEFQGFVDGIEPSVHWLDRKNMPQVGDRLFAIPAHAAVPRSWSILLTSANHGTVGPLGSTFPHAGEHHERVVVVEVPASAGAPSDQVNLVLRAAPAAEAGASTVLTDEPQNGIAATHRHDEGAIARCSYCGRYSLDPATLSDRQPACECGRQHGWSGSFKKPEPDSRWSGKAPAAREVAAQAGQVAVPEDARQSILQAVTNCRHSIESKCVKLYAAPNAEGNALSQLVDRIMAAAPSPAKESK